MSRRHQVTKRPFWTSAKVLLQFKAPLGLALGGAIVSALCFGAGISMVLPILNLLLEQGQPLGQWIIKSTADGTFAVFGQWLAQHIPEGQFAAFAMVMIVIGVLGVIGSSGRYVHQLLTIMVIQRAVVVWRNRLYRQIIHAPMSHVLQSGNADHISRIVMDVRFMASGYNAILGKAVPKTLHGAAALIAAFMFDWVLASLALISAPFMTVMLRKFGTVIRRSSRRALRTRARMLGALRESLAGIRVVKVHNAEGQERRRFGRINRALFNEEMKMRRVKAMTSPLMETLGLWVVLCIAMLAAWYTFVQQQQPTQSMGVLIMLVVAVSCLKPLSSLNNTLHGASAAASRVLELLKIPVEPTGPNVDPATIRLQRHQNSINFQSITFTYPGQREPALRDVSFEVEHGQLAAVVGTNGSGKTTLISLLPRLLTPSQGRILIDGVDITTVSLRSLRKQIGMVTQDSILFAGTISQNIAYGQGQPSTTQIVSAARSAHADKFISYLPNGYETVLGEDGSGLSGGQRQRLCIARAILRDPAILILDEATSQIDADSEAQINEALSEFHQGRTTFIIAHRLSTVINADTIIVMHEGSVADQGTHDELLERSDTYRLLTRTQLQPVA